MKFLPLIFANKLCICNSRKTNVKIRQPIWRIGSRHRSQPRSRLNPLDPPNGEFCPREFPFPFKFPNSASIKDHISRVSRATIFVIVRSAIRTTRCLIAIKPTRTARLFSSRNFPPVRCLDHRRPSSCRPTDIGPGSRWPYPIQSCLPHRNSRRTKFACMCYHQASTLPLVVPLRFTYARTCSPLVIPSLLTPFFGLSFANSIPLIMQSSQISVISS